MVCVKPEAGRHFKDGACKGIGKGILRIDFIKIDVEGFEYHVLEGGKTFISTFKPIMAIDIHADPEDPSKTTEVKVIEFLSQYEYTSDGLTVLIKCLNNFPAPPTILKLLTVQYLPNSKTLSTLVFPVAYLFSLNVITATNRSL